MIKGTAARLHRRAVLAGLVLALAGTALPLPAIAQDAEWPVKPIRFIVPFASGTSDALARMLGAQVAEALGQPVVVENKVEASGTIGSTIVLPRALSTLPPPAIRPCRAGRLHAPHSNVMRL
jgi:hypothetical protein